MRKAKINIVSVAMKNEKKMDLEKQESIERVVFKYIQKYIDKYTYINDQRRYKQREQKGKKTRKKINEETEKIYAGKWREQKINIIKVNYPKNIREKMMKKYKGIKQTRIHK